MRKSRVLIPVAAAGMLVAAWGAPASAESARSVEIAGRYTVACNKPGNTANFSWKQGTYRTTVYYNNHCSHQVKVTVHMSDAGPNTHCLKAKAKKKTKVTYRQGAYGSFDGLTRGC